MDVFLSDRSRRFLCRTAFVLLCVLPTTFALRCVLLPVTVADWESRLHRSLGIPVSIEHIQAVSPQRTVLLGVRLGHQPRFEMALDRVELSDTSQSRQLVIGRMRGSAHAFWKTLQRLAQQQTWREASSRPYVVEIDRLEVTRDDQPDEAPLVFRQLSIELAFDRSRLIARFAPQEVNSLEPIVSAKERMTLIVHRQPEDPSLAQVELHTAMHSIPAWLLKPPLPALSCLNDSCQISGTLQLDTGSDRAAGLFSGTLQDLDLSDVVATRFGYTLTGQAHASIEKAEVRGGRLVRLRGKLESPSGVLDTKLAHSLSRYWSVQIVEAALKDGRYRALAFGFDLDDHEITLFGLKPDGAIALNQVGQPMLIASQGAKHSVTRLISLLSDPAEGLSRSLLDLMQCLTLPPTAEPGRARVQIAEEVGNSFFK